MTFDSEPIHHDSDIDPAMMDWLEERNPGLTHRSQMLAAAALFVEVQKTGGKINILTDDGIMGIDDLALREAVQAVIQGDEAAVFIWQNYGYSTT